jgi:AcrR family transcriptional regulator
VVDPLPLDPSTEAAVFDAARQVLAEQWAPSLTLHAVAERAGVELERLYRRWPRPASLLAEMLGRAGAIADIPDLGDTRQELSVALHQMIGAYTERPHAERTLLRLALTVNHDGDELVRVRELGEQHWRGKVVAALHRAVARGDLPPEADAELIVDIWAGAIAYRRTFRGDPLDATVVEVLLDLVLSGRVPLQLPELPEPPADAWPEPLTDALNWLSGVPVGRMFGIADGVPYRLLEQAPERRTVIGGHRVTVTAGVARNFMPVRTEQRSRMSAGVAVDAEGAGMLPPFLRADRIVVLHGDDVWVAPLDEEFLAARSSRGFRAVARLGPTWTPGEQVDIVVRLVGHGGVARLVRVSGQLIGRSD